jgi:hypothetical protein
MEYFVSLSPHNSLPAILDGQVYTVQPLGSSVYYSFTLQVPCRLLSAPHQVAMLSKGYLRRIFKAVEMNSKGASESPNAETVNLKKGNSFGKGKS